MLRQCGTLCAMKVKIGTTVEERDVERLEALAREADVSLAWLLRKILRDYLAAQAV